MHGFFSPFTDQVEYFIFQHSHFKCLCFFVEFHTFSPWLSRMEIKDKRFKCESFIRILPKYALPLVTYKGVLLHVCCFFICRSWLFNRKQMFRQGIRIGNVCARTKICLSKPFWTVVFQVWQAFSSCALLLFPSSSAAEVLPDLVLLFLLSSARTYLLLTDELNHFMFLLLLAVPTQ
jgi:hypothetical protein